jgi:hypothetical protein
MTSQLARRGPPPLVPFGLILHHDGSWTHEGQPLVNRKLRERFDRSVRYLPDEGKYVVEVGRFRGEIEVEEAGFFVRLLDTDAGTIALSDGSSELLDVESLGVSGLDGALLCIVKRELREGGLLARFQHAAHAELLNAVGDDGETLKIGGRSTRLPDLERGSSGPVEVKPGCGRGSRPVPQRSRRP